MDNSEVEKMHTTIGMPVRQACHAFAFTLAVGLPSVHSGEIVPLTRSVALRAMSSASPTVQYAVHRVATELRQIHGLNVTEEFEVENPFADLDDDKGIVVLAEPEHVPALASRYDWWDIKKVTQVSGTHAYRVTILAAPVRVLVVGSDPVGTWYGACAWMDSLISGPEGMVHTPLHEHQGSPALAIRFTRGIKPRGEFKGLQDAITTLDWWARWRMNTVRITKVPELLLPEFLVEAHKRGIRVLLGRGVRHLCAADDQALAQWADQFERFLQLGGDGISVMWDDLPHERCYGHCDNCRHRFGPNSLPHETVHILEALCDVAARCPGHQIIAWCPSHYSVNRYPEMSDQDFFRVIGASSKVREQTYMYYCEFAPQFVEILNRAGVKHLIWSYNGMRGVYELCHRFAPRPEMQLTIPGMKSFPQPTFAPFDRGYHMGIGALPDGSIAWPSDATWRSLRRLPERFEGYYPCMALHPYHAAVGALFALSPKRFKQAEADRVVFRAIFGPASSKPARKWSDLYDEFQVWLARTIDRPIPEEEKAKVVRRMEEWRKLRREIEVCAAGGHTLLNSEILKSVLAQMQKAEETVEQMLKQRLPGSFTAGFPVSQ